MRPVIKNDFTAKIAIMYIIDKFAGTVEEEDLTVITTTICEMNYFTFRQYIYELVQSNFIRHYPSDGLELYVLTEKGLEALKIFTSKLAYSSRVKINDYIKDYSPDNKEKNKFICDYMPVSDLEYNVKLSYNEGEMPLMQLELRAGDRQQALEIMRLMKDNKERIYTDVYNYIMKLASENKEDINDTNFFD